MLGRLQAPRFRGHGSLTTARARMRAKGSSGTGTLSISFGLSDLIGPREQPRSFCP